jgi:flagellar FliL protein
MAGNDNNAEDAGKQNGGMKRALLAGAGAVILIVLGVFAGPMLKNVLSGPANEAQSADASSTAAMALYTSLHPPLVVNFKDTFGASHYMQMTMEVMARDQKTIDAVKQHTPVVRNALILLYGNVDYDALNTREGKEKMLEDGLREIQAVMEQETGAAGVEALYFTSLIIQ